MSKRTSQPDTWTDRQTDRQTYRHAETETDKAHRSVQACVDVLARIYTGKKKDFYIVM